MILDAMDPEGWGQDERNEEKQRLDQLARNLDLARFIEASCENKLSREILYKPRVFSMEKEK